MYNQRSRVHSGSRWFFLYLHSYLTHATSAHSNVKHNSVSKKGYAVGCSISLLSSQIPLHHELFLKLDSRESENAPSQWGYPCTGRVKCSSRSEGTGKAVPAAPSPPMLQKVETIPHIQCRAMNTYMELNVHLLRASAEVKGIQVGSLKEKKQKTQHFRCRRHGPFFCVTRIHLCLRHSIF